MLIFLDTEFTDFIDCELISIGTVSPDGKHTFYAERNDYPANWCNYFVRAAVLPSLGKVPEATCDRAELTSRLRAWFASLPRHVQIACDSRHDQDLLWDAFDEQLPENLDRKRYDLAQLLTSSVFHKAVYDFQTKQGGWHHALNDAKAHRAGWLAWVDHKRRLNESKKLKDKEQNDNIIDTSPLRLLKNARQRAERERCLEEGKTGNHASAFRHIDLERVIVTDPNTGKVWKRPTQKSDD